MGNTLGLDLGTSAVKALLIGPDQQVIASASSSLTMQRPQPGWSEQDPLSWQSAACKAIDAIHQTHPLQLQKLTGIGLSGQMHGATLLNDADQPLRPAILWNDTRSHQEAATLDANPVFRHETGNIVFPGFTAPKLLWCQQHEPDLFGQIRTVLLPKDFLRLWLTGEKVTDPSDAAGTSWLDVGKRTWSENLLQASGLELSAMPSIVEGSQPSGQLRTELANRWGITAAVTVAGGAGDNAASACGLGVIAAGTAFASLGTSGVLFAANDAYRPNPASAVHTFCHALPQTWHQMGVVLSATDALNWYAGIVGQPAATLAAELDNSPSQPPSEITFTPYLSGERTPHNEPRPLGSFLGLSHQHDRQAMTRAVLTGVAFAIRDCLEALASTGTRLSSVTAVGGGSQSGAWLQILSNALQLPVDVPTEGDFGAALGAARLGHIAASGADPASICLPPAIQQRYEPEATVEQAYRESYQTYRQAYPALSALLP